MAGTRVNLQGVDMNRSYFAEGADPQKQAHEACVLQTDLQGLMASPCPVTDIWSMHTWAGIVEPLLLAGPEMGTSLGPWTDLRDAIERHDPKNLVKALKIRKEGGPTTWYGGPHQQFGISAILCEGAGDLYTKQENLDSGVVLMQGIAEYYKGTKKSKLQLGNEGKLAPQEWRRVTLLSAQSSTTIGRLVLARRSVRTRTQRSGTRTPTRFP